jgi:ribonuclease HI
LIIAADDTGKSHQHKAGGAPRGEFVQHLYSDGGCINKNPSSIGGMWAWCLVENGRRVKHKSGLIETSPSLPLVTNNLTELLAAVLALEEMPNEWAGTIWTDSKVTLYRISKYRKKKRASFKGVPEWLKNRVDVLHKRLGAYSTCLVAGHPSIVDLERGTRKGVPCSIHNVFCDNLCRDEAVKWRKSRLTVSTSH